MSDGLFFAFSWTSFRSSAPLETENTGHSEKTCRESTGKTSRCKIWQTEGTGGLSYTFCLFYFIVFNLIFIVIFLDVVLLLSGIVYMNPFPKMVARSECWMNALKPYADIPPPLVADMHFSGKQTGLSQKPKQLLDLKILEESLDFRESLNQNDVTLVKFPCYTTTWEISAIWLA